MAVPRSRISEPFRMVIRCSHPPEPKCGFADALKADYSSQLLYRRSWKSSPPPLHFYVVAVFTLARSKHSQIAFLFVSRANGTRVGQIFSFSIDPSSWKGIICSFGYQIQLVFWQRRRPRGNSSESSQINAESLKMNDASVLIFSADLFRKYRPRRY